MSIVTESFNPVRVTAGAGATVAALGSFRAGERPLVIRDAVLDRPVSLALAGAVDIPVDAPALDHQAIRDIAVRGRDATAIIAYGGGSTLDAAKLARVLLCRPRVDATLTALAARSGLVRLPDVAGRRARSIPLLAIPTTLGTGSEVSQVSCMMTSAGRRLIVGAELRIDHAVLDPAHTATLPRRQQSEGLFEVLLRVMGAVIGSDGESAAADADARRIVVAGAQLSERLRAGELTADERLYAAQLSAATHTTWALVGRRTFAAKHWYLANELSAIVAGAKIPTTIALLPALWGFVQDGDGRWGCSARLSEAWSWVRDVVPALPSDIRTGLRALYARWGLEPLAVPPSRALDDAAESVVQAWGGSLPALAQVDRREIRRVFSAAFPDTAESIHPRRRKEVRKK